MFRLLLRKVTGKKKEKKPKKAEKMADSLRKKSSQFTGFVNNSLNEAAKEFGVIRKKMKNLEATNFDLGRMHIKNGDVKEAAFRFFLMTKFFPNNLDARYELAYCYAIRDKFRKSQKTLESLLRKEPNYDKRAEELLEYVKKMQKS